jgi:hypothetical protein
MVVKPERLPKSDKEMEFDRLMRNQYATASSVWINDKGGRNKEFRSLKHKANKLQVKKKTSIYCKSNHGRLATSHPPG